MKNGGPSNQVEPARPAADTTRTGHAAFMTLATIALVVLALYVGRDILIPFALAVLLSFALSPLVTRLQRIGAPRVAAVVLVVAAAFGFIGAFGVLIGSQVTQLLEQLPTYQQNLHSKIAGLQETAPGGGTLGRVSTMLRELQADLAPTSPADDAIPVVRLKEPPRSQVDVLQSVVAPLLGPVLTAGIVIVLVIFMLFEREELRNRLIRLLGPDLHVTTDAIDEAGRRVSRYLLMQLVVNATYGVPLGVGLYLIGVPNALLWGVLATLLRFIPFLGPFIAALFPAALSIAVAPAWNMFFWTIGLILTLELISNNFVEPWLYGASTGMSAIAVLTAAVFWTTLWGPIGLFLSTPITVCLAVLGHYVPQLRFFETILGSSPALSPAEHFYQRLLAGDPDEDIRLAEEYLKEHTLVDFYDQIALPALRLAEYDRRRRGLSTERRAMVTESVLRVVADLADHEDPSVAPTTRSGGENMRPVLCVAGRSDFDLAGAMMLAQILELQGMSVKVMPAEAMRPTAMASLDLTDFEAVCMFYLDAAAEPQAQQTCARIQRVAPTLPIVVGIWGGPHRGAPPAEHPDSPPQPIRVTTIGEASQRIAELTRLDAAPYMAAPAPPDEQERLQDLKRLGLLDTPRSPALDQLTARLADAFKAPIALITLIDEERQYWKAATGLPEALARARQAPRETSVCGHVVANNETMVIDDLWKDPRFANNPFLREHGIRFYAGSPLRSPNGRAIGSLCVLDTVPRQTTPTERALLQLLADEVMQMLPHLSASNDDDAEQDRVVL